MKTLLLAVTLLVGCGGPPPDAGRLVDICNVSWWGDVYLYTRDVSCAEVQQRFALAKIATSGFTDTSTFQGTPVYVLDVDCLEKWPIEGAAGFYCKEGETSIDGVVLERNLQGLAHEMFHLLDRRNLQVLSAWHEGWEERGYTRAADAYSDTIANDVRAKLDGEGSDAR